MKMKTKIDPLDVAFDKNADYYNDPTGLAVCLIEELIDWRNEKAFLEANGGSEETIAYFNALLIRTETILSRLGVQNIPFPVEA